MKKKLLLSLFILASAGINAKETWTERIAEALASIFGEKTALDQTAVNEKITDAKNNIQQMINNLTPEQKDTLTKNSTGLTNSLTALSTGKLGLTNLPAPLDKIYAIVKATYDTLMTHATPERIAQAKQFVSDIISVVVAQKAATPEVIKPEEKPVPVVSPTAPVAPTPATTTAPLPASTVLNK